MMKPVIGILPMINGENQSYIIQNYIDAIEYGGGMAILLPHTVNNDSIEKFTEICDGFLFAGGHDIEPWRYGEEKLPDCESTAPLRDEIEFLAFEKIFPTKKPILGICRGLQLINIALGGTLYQDIPTQVVSTVVHRHKTTPSTHLINIEKNSPIGEKLSTERVTVNSYHHQAIKKLGTSLEAMARADDGIVEAAYMSGRKFLWLLQWHPEKTMEDELSQIIFKEFIKATK